MHMHKFFFFLLEFGESSFANDNNFGCQNMSTSFSENIPRVNICVLLPDVEL